MFSLDFKSNRTSKFIECEEKSQRKSARVIEHFDAIFCSSKPLARQLSNRQYSIGFANVLLRRFFIFVNLEAM